MPKYEYTLLNSSCALLTYLALFCDYCDVYLTHDSMSVRKDHNSGRNHIRNVVDYYQRMLDGNKAMKAPALKHHPQKSDMKRPSW